MTVVAYVQHTGLQALYLGRGIRVHGDGIVSLVFALGGAACICMGGPPRGSLMLGTTMCRLRTSRTSSAKIHGLRFIVHVRIAIKEIRR